MKISLFSQSLFALPLAEAIQTTADIGFPAIEVACIAPHLDYGTARLDAAGVAAQIRNAGLVVSALSLFNNFTDQADLKNQLRMAETFIDLARLFDTKLIKMTPGPPASRAAEEEHWRCLGAALGELIPMARAADVRLAFETHMRQLTDTLSSSERFLEMSPPDCIGLTVDFSNLSFAGEQMPHVIARLKDRMYHTHIKNGYIDAQGGWHFEPLDRGLTDYSVVLRLLRDARYDGDLSLLVSGAGGADASGADGPKGSGKTTAVPGERVMPDANIVIEGIDRRISTLALGTAFYGLKDQATWFGILDAFLDQGGTVLDTGRHYGESEDVLGRWLESRGTRDRVVLTTKGGHGTGHGVETGDFAATIERELTTSLERLRIEYVDLYLLHRDSPAVPVGEIMDCLNAELARGRVRAIGASNWRYDRIAEANEYAYAHNLRRFSAVSNNISLAVPAEPFFPGLVSVEPAGEEWHRQTGTPLIVWSSQARGFFTGRYTPQMRTAAPGVLDESTARMIEVYGTDGNFERLRRAATLGRSKGGYSAVQIALAWLLHKPFPLVPIVGPRTREELGSCLQAVSIQLTSRETHWLNLAPSVKTRHP